MTLNMEFETDKPFGFEFGDWVMALLSDPDAVKYTPQEGKTDEEKAQARNNIAAAVDVITSEYNNNPKRLIDLPEGPHELTGYFAYNAQSDEEGITFYRDLVSVKRFDVENAVLVQGFKGRALHSIIVAENYVEHQSKNIFEQDAPDQVVIPFVPDPTIALTPEMLSRLYKPVFYTTLPGAVSDLNAGTTANADATAENALCAIYTDYDGNTCLILLSDITLSELLTISADVVFKINGYTVNITCAGYALTILGNVTIDGRVEGSAMTQIVTENSVGCAIARVSGTANFIGCRITVSSDLASKLIAAIISDNGKIVVDNCTISSTINSGSSTCYGIYCSYGSLVAKNTLISVTSKGSAAYGITDRTKSDGMTIDNCSVNVYCTGRSEAIQTLGNVAEISNCEILSTGHKTYGVNSTTDTTIRSCNIKTLLAENIANTDCYSYGILCQAKTQIYNCDIFADGIHGGDETGALPGQSLGVIIGGLATVKNCKVFGTHSGIQCNQGSTTILDGGLYEGVGHGGIYFANVDGNFYGQNATFRCVPYRGAYRDQYLYQNTDYLNAAAYVTSNPGLKAYVDNCVFDGNGPCMSGTDSNGEPMGGEPIRFRSGGNGNALYASNCTFMGDGKIRFGGGNQHLYLGFGNRVLCEANLPNCVDSTTYKNKVFTSYEEV